MDRQQSLPDAASLGNVSTATQKAPKQTVSSDRAATNSEEGGIDRKAALQVLEAVEAKCETPCTSLHIHCFCRCTHLKSGLLPFMYIPLPHMRF